MSDQPQDQTASAQPDAPHSQLLARLRARQRRSFTLRPAHGSPLVIRGARRPSHPAGAAQVALTAHQILALVQRLRRKGSQSAVWASQIGALAPVTFHRFAAEIAQRAHILHPLSIPKPASSALRPGPVPLELTLPTGGVQPGLTLPGEMGAGAKISLPSPFSIPQPGGQVIPRISPTGEMPHPPSITPLPAGQKVGAPQSRPPARPQAKKLPPKSRLYTRVEEIQRGQELPGEKIIPSPASPAMPPVGAKQPPPALSSEDTTLRLPSPGRPAASEVRPPARKPPSPDIQRTPAALLSTPAIRAKQSPPTPSSESLPLPPIGSPVPLRAARPAPTGQRPPIPRARPAAPRPSPTREAEEQLPHALLPPPGMMLLPFGARPPMAIRKALGEPPQPVEGEAPTKGGTPASREEATLTPLAAEESARQFQQAAPPQPAASPQAQQPTIRGSIPRPTPAAERHTKMFIRRRQPTRLTHPPQKIRVRRRMLQVARKTTLRPLKALPAQPPITTEKAAASPLPLHLAHAEAKVAELVAPAPIAPPDMPAVGAKQLPPAPSSEDTTLRSRAKPQSPIPPLPAITPPKAEPPPAAAPLARPRQSQAPLPVQRMVTPPASNDRPLVARPPLARRLRVGPGQALVQRQAQAAPTQAAAMPGREGHGKAKEKPTSLPPGPRPGGPAGTMQLHPVPPSEDTPLPPGAKPLSPIAGQAPASEQQPTLPAPVLEQAPLAKDVQRQAQARRRMRLVARQPLPATEQKAAAQKPTETARQAAEKQAPVALNRPGPTPSRKATQPSPILSRMAAQPQTGSPASQGHPALPRTEPERRAALPLVRPARPPVHKPSPALLPSPRPALPASGPSASYTTSRGDSRQQQPANKPSPLAMTLAQSKQAKPAPQAGEEGARRPTIQKLSSTPPKSAVSDLVQRTVGIEEGEETPEPASDLNSLAQSILPIIRRMLEIERERRPF